MNAAQDSNDMLDRALADIAAERPTGGPSPELLSQTLAGIDDVPRDNLFVAPRRLAKIAALILTAIGVAVVIWSAVTSFQPQFAFADVLATTRAARTKTCRVTIEGPGHPPATYVQMLKEPDLMRMEFPDGQVFIDNWRAGTHITLDPTRKTATVSTMTGDALGPAAFSNRSLDQLAAQSVHENLPPRQINGRPAVGFRFSHAQVVNDIWADAKTRQPIRTEMSINDGGKATRVTVDDFKFDVPMPDSLFEVPPGYQVIKGSPVRNEVRRLGPSTAPSATTQH